MDLGQRRPCRRRPARRAGYPGGAFLAVGASPLFASGVPPQARGSQPSRPTRALSGSSSAISPSGLAGTSSTPSSGASASPAGSRPSSAAPRSSRRAPAPPALTVPIEFFASGEFWTDAPPSLSSWLAGGGTGFAANARPSALLLAPPAMRSEQPEALQSTGGALSTTSASGHRDEGLAPVAPSDAAGGGAAGTHRFLQDVQAPRRSAHAHWGIVVMQDLTPEHGLLRWPPDGRPSTGGDTCPGPTVAHRLNGKGRGSGTAIVVISAGFKRRLPGERVKP